MRHRKPRPVRPWARWGLATAAVAALGGTSSAVALGAHTSTPQGPQVAPVAQRPVTPSIGARTLSPSRSTPRDAGSAQPRHRRSADAPVAKKPSPAARPSTGPRSPLESVTKRAHPVHPKHPAHGSPGGKPPKVVASASMVDLGSAVDTTLDEVPS